MNDAGTVGAPAGGMKVNSKGKPYWNGTIGPATSTPKVSGTGAMSQGPIGAPAPAAPKVGKASGVGPVGTPVNKGMTGGSGGTMEAVAGQKAATPGVWSPKGSSLRAAQNASPRSPVRGSAPFMGTLPSM